MGAIERFLNWWRRPPAEERILDAMSFTEWRRGFDVAKSAKVWTGKFYATIFELEEKGVIESKWSDAPLKPERGYRRDRVYRRVMSGKRRHVEQTDRSPVINAELST